MIKWQIHSRDRLLNKCFPFLLLDPSGAHLAKLSYLEGQMCYIIGQ